MDKSLNALYHLHPQIKDIVDENNELKKENEKLKEQIEGDNLWGINKGLKQEKSDLIKQYKRVVKENCEIKKELEKMKAFLGELRINVVKLDENEELKKENEKLKNQVACFQCLVHWLDPRCNGDSPDKEHIDEFCEEAEYDDDVKKMLYNDFNIDEDEDEDED